jgi:hypothetical protein
MNRPLIAVLLTSVAACGSDTPGAGPSQSTTTAITVTVPGPLRMGQTAQATATETLSDGQTRPITSGFSSDAAAVAAVTSSGLVTGIANGRATISAVAGGRQGQQGLRVVPDYQGRWSGGLRVTSCTQTGIFADFDFCDDSPNGTTYHHAVSLSQSGEQMTAVVDYGPPYVFPGIAAPIREDGTSAFTPSVSASESGITLTVDAAYTVNSARLGELTGTVNEVWRIPGFTGEGRLAQDIVATTRSSTAAPSSVREGSARRLSFLRKVAAQKR